jgi:2-polyprenyl-3-methyl-5-hydroxy-6-metoxy-1,4-benzoquinol methylase
VNAFGIAIQVAARNWSGGEDFCVKEIDGKQLYRLTLDRCRILASKMKHGALVALVSPDRIDERKAFAASTQSDGVRCFFGSEHDVLNRLIDFCRENSLDAIFRVNGSFWYLDPDVCMKILDAFSSLDADLVKLPSNYPHGFAGEIMKLSALEQLRSLVNGKTVTNPVAEMYQHDGFVIREIDPPAAVSSEWVDCIREKRLQYEPERVEFSLDSVFIEGSIDLKRYMRALDVIESKDRVLDIACGAGFGSDLIAKKASSVIGGDYNQDVIDYCRSHFSKSNLAYEVADITKLHYEAGYFDAVVSMETIEHVDERLFIDNVFRVLKPGGKLILSTPQNNYGFCLTPWHLKEYSLREIKDLLAPYFVIDRILGVTSATIDEQSEEGDRMLLFAKKK